MRPTRTNAVLAAFASPFLTMVLSAALFAQTTAPSSTPNAAPATAPTAVRTPVMLVPFQSVGQNDHDAWISQGIDEDLANDMSRNRAIVVLRPPVTIRAQPLDALASARSANASLLVTGSIQVVDDQLRITADVIDVSGMKSIGQLKVTGRLHDLFQLEDGLATQLWRTLPRPSGESPTASSNEPGFTVTPLQQYDMGTSQAQSSVPFDQSSGSLINPINAPNSYVSGPGPYSSYYAPAYTYPVPYNDYPFGFYGSSFILIGPGFNRGDHGGGHNFSNGGEFVHRGSAGNAFVPRGVSSGFRGVGTVVSHGGSAGGFGGHR